MSAYSARIGVPEGSHAYWRELLLRCGLAAEPLGSSALDPVALFLPDAAGLEDAALLRAVMRLRGRGVPIVAGAEWGAKLLGGRVRGIAAFGLDGLRAVAPDAPSVRMPVRVQALERATEGRIWPARVGAVARSSDWAPICVLPLARAGDLLASASELVAFACGEDRTVGELVASVDHGALRRLVLGALRETTRAAARVLVRKSEGPGEHGGVFAFRIDADGFRTEATRATLAALQGGRVRATWFVDVERHLLLGGEPWIAAIRERGHELGTHFYHHYTYVSGAKNERNLARSLVELRKLGIEVTSAAAPFGSWNDGLHEALRSCRMQWSSEFARLYDDVPCVLDGRSGDVHEPWQVPVHPVCPGLLLQRGFSAREVAAYFVARLHERLDRGDPAVFYGHPIGELELVPALFVELDRALASRSTPVWRATLGELFAFERARRAQPLDCRVEDGVLEGSTPGPAGAVVESAGGTLRVPPGGFALTIPGGPAGTGLSRAKADDRIPTNGPWLPATRRAARWKGRRLRLLRLAREVRS